MANFLPVDEQLDLLKKGAAEIIRVSDLRERLEKSRQTGVPLRVKRASTQTLRSPPRAHRSIRKLKHFKTSATM